jgi:hypothetical protein
MIAKEPLLKALPVLLLFCLAAAASATHAQTTRVRGTIAGLDGDVLLVKAPDGRETKVELSKNAVVEFPKALKLTDLQPGTGLGTTAVAGPDGKLIAREVHVFPADRAVPSPGHRPFESEPTTSMTNGAVSAAVEIGNGRELLVNYKGGMQTLIVTDSTPVVIYMPADRSLLKPGEYVSVIASMNNDGKWSSSRVQVSKDGVRPPQ